MTCSHYELASRSTVSRAIPTGTFYIVESRDASVRYLLGTAARDMSHIRNKRNITSSRLSPTRLSESEVDRTVMNSVKDRAA